MSEATSTAVYRCGYVAVTGLPNVGKSTLVNRIVGEPLAIVTSKPQTTRNRLLGIYSGPKAQAIFVDTPGLCRDAKALHRFLNVEVNRALGDADIVLVLLEPTVSDPEQEAVLLDRVSQAGKPAFGVVNKTDRMRRPEVLLPRLDTLGKSGAFERVFCVSALTGDGVPDLVAATVERLPEGPALYPEDELTTANMRFIVAEMVREQVFLQTEKEIPYATAVVVQAYREREDGHVSIAADIVLERESQKGIVIGAKGSRLKSIGRAARERIEAFIQGPVYLELFVRVEKDWSGNDRLLGSLGYE